MTRGLLSRCARRSGPRTSSCSLALLFGQRLTDLPSVLHALAAFVIFCALSGVVYLINDVADREADRRHPVKCGRPIASGAVPVPAALTLAAVLAAVALAAAFCAAAAVRRRRAVATSCCWRSIRGR